MPPPSVFPAPISHAHAELTHDFLRLTLHVAHPTAAVVTAVASGPLRYGWLEPLPGFPLLLVLLDEDRWVVDVALNVRRELPEEASRGAWLAGLSTGGQLELMLVEASTGQTVARRLVQVETTFRRGLREQLGRQVGEASTGDLVNDVYRRVQQVRPGPQLLATAHLFDWPALEARMGRE